MKKFSSTTKASYRRSWLTRRIRIAIILVISLVLVGWVLPSFTRTIAGLVLQPVVAVSSWLESSQATIPSYLRDRNDLQAIIITQAEELALTATLAVERDVLRLENNRLRRLSASSTQPGIIAHVLVQPPLVQYDRLIINRGTRAGVRVGAPVFAGEYVAIGTVISATAGQSVVELISSPQLESTVFVFGPDIYTTAVGLGGGVLEIGVPQGVPIAVGNLVTLPAGSQSIIGAIHEVATTSTQAEQYAYVTLPEALLNLQTVLVGTEPLTAQSFTEARTQVDAVRASRFTVPVPDGVLVDIFTEATSSATTTATTTNEL